MVEAPAADDLNASVTELPGIGAVRARLLAGLGINTVGDLLTLIPRRWIDRARLTPSGQAAERAGQTVTVVAPVARARAVRIAGKPPAARIDVDDGSGSLAVWFWGRGYLANTLTPGTVLALTGTVNPRRGGCLDNPEYEILEDGADTERTAAPIPVYPLTKGLGQRELRRMIETALERYGDRIAEPLPEWVLRELRLPGRAEAIRYLHRPGNTGETEAALRRFRYEEALRLQLGLAIRRARYRNSPKIPRETRGNRLAFLPTILPYQLTSAQQRVIGEILQDMAAPYPMTRLVQGDVGCGKTVVTLHAIAAAADSGLQTALLAPTETLAEQHALSLDPYFQRLGIRATLITANSDPFGEARRRLYGGQIDVAIGTHALLQDYTVFRNLGLVVIDEQHRFGVLQRLRLAAKGARPDLLQLSATPIPRSLAAVISGELDISVIDERPSGRLPVKTARIPESKRLDMYRWAREQAGKGIQICVVCPSIAADPSEPDEEAPPSDLEAHADYLARQTPLGDLSIACLHGRMPSREKRRIFEDYRDGRIAALVATTVVEVGVEAPGAGIMIIENAWRFGLSQLHQLRGRVGRTARQDYCFLMGAPPSEEAGARLDALCRCHDGFALAEEDLRLRGPGDLMGLRQSGSAALRFPETLADPEMMAEIRRIATRLLEQQAVPLSWAEEDGSIRGLPAGV